MAEVDAQEHWPRGRARDGGVDEITLPRVPGRLWLCGKHVVGADPDAALARVGADVLVCLNQRHELEARYPAYTRWLQAHVGGRARWHPIADLHAPEPAAALAMVESMVADLADGRGVLMHCGAGIGRAGTMAVGILVRLGVPSAEALEQVARQRPMAGPEAGVQRDLVASMGDWSGLTALG